MSDVRFVWALVAVFGALGTGWIGLMFPSIPFTGLFVQGFLVLAAGLLISIVFWGSGRE